jgi:hypothetical protein
MRKFYGLYNISKDCLEHLEKIDLKSTENYTIFRLDNYHGVIWATKDIKIAEAVRLGEFRDIHHTSKEMPYNPYKENELKIVELDLFCRLLNPLPKIEDYVVLVSVA